MVTKQYIESVERLIPLETYKHGMTRSREGSVYYINFLEDLEGTQKLSIEFVSSRGRDAAYAEIINNLGRTSVISIARYQEWANSLNRG